MSTTNTNFSTLIAAIDSKAQSLASSTTNAKDLVFLGKAIEALNIPDSVSGIIAEGDTQVAAVNTAGTTQVASVQSEGATQVAALQAAAGGFASISELTITVAGGKFVVDGTSQQALNLSPSVMYRFDVSDASNSGHPLKFSTTADGTHGSGSEFTTGVTVSGTAGTANAYVQIIVEQDSPTLYYYCGNHAAMGAVAYAAYNVLSVAPTDGQVLAYSAVAAAYVNTTSSSGSLTMTEVGSAGTQIFTPASGWNWNTTYQSPLIRRGGYTGNTFGLVAMAQNQSSTDTAAYGNAVTVNPANGHITATSTNTQLWLNTTINAMSTTWFHHPYGTGGVYYSGNNGWPGTNTHKFGYGTAYLTNNGSWSHVATVHSSEDHGGNGSYYSIPTDSTSGRFMTSGYNQQNGLARYRISTFSNTSFSIGSSQNPSSNTSTTYNVSFTGNKDATINANTPVSAIHYQDGSSNKIMRIVGRDGSASSYTMGNWGSSNNAFLLTNGTVVLWQSSGDNYAGNQYNTMSSISARFPLALTSYSHAVHVENNKFMRTVYAGDGRDGIALFEINPTTYEVTLLQVASLDISDYDFQNSYTDFSVIYNSSNAPAYILGGRKESGFQSFKTWEWPFS